MPINNINGVDLYWELTGTQGDPLVLAHGSWGNHHNWDAVVSRLSKTFRVLTYDRRGHSRSERLPGQGSFVEDADDLVALVENLGLAPAHIAGNSGGSAIVLKAAVRRPEIFRTMVVHEPPLFGLLADDPEAEPVLQTVNSRIQAVASLIKESRNEEAARLFVETVALGPGQWAQLPESLRQTFIYNAPTFLDETSDPTSMDMDTSGLSYFSKPALLTCGTQSPPLFPLVIEKLVKAIPGVTRLTFEGAGHVPHISHPLEYVEVVKDFCLTTTKEVRREHRLL